jgi:hypothetical protein
MDDPHIGYRKKTLIQKNSRTRMVLIIHVGNWEHDWIPDLATSEAIIISF